VICCDSPDSDWKLSALDPVRSDTPLPHSYTGHLCSFVFLENLGRFLPKMIFRPGGGGRNSLQCKFNFRLEIDKTVVSTCVNFIG